MQAGLPGKTVSGFELRGTENFQRMGFFNRDFEEFRVLVGETVTQAVSRGNTMVIKLSGAQNLVLSPEYGGEVFFHESGAPLSASYHFRLDFADGSALTVRITSMGCVTATREDGLTEHYLVRRDFDPDKWEPHDEALSPELFAALLTGATRQLKSVLVGKDAVVVGLSNSAFQDIIYRAGLHPRRKASDLSAEETRALYEAMRFVVAERLRLGGKAKFRDLYGRPGGYEPAMGPEMKGRDCPVCGMAVQKLSHGGGYVFLCPRCQRDPG
jgi:formamidopyrimidine-DNA glycosylase